MRLVFASLFVVGAIATSPSAGHACGATETIFEGLLPLADQTDVPTDAVLWATGNFSSLELHLRKVPTTEELSDIDAGAAALKAEAVLVDTTCLPLHDQRLCRGQAELEPNTEYEWYVAAETDSVDPESPWRRFTTGDASVPPSQSEPDIEVSVADNEVHEFYGCGGEAQVVGLQFDAAELAEPVVVASDMPLGHPHAWAWLLEPGAAAQIIEYLPRGPCAELIAYDLSGREYPLRRVCFDAELEPSYLYSDGTRVPLSEVNTSPDDEAAISDGEAPRPAARGVDMPPSGSESSPAEESVATNRIEPNAEAGCSLNSSGAVHAPTWVALLLALGFLGLRVGARQPRVTLRG